MGLKRKILALLLFAIAFGYVEAAAVVYLRAVFVPLHNDIFRAVPHDDLFPLPTVENLRAAGPEYVHLLGMELVRELATMVMLAATGLAIAGNFRQWLAGFMISFGVWDIVYYLGLRLLVGWPQSLMDWDLLFLLPVPWAGPVIAPVIIAVSMIVAGGVILAGEAAERPLRFSGLDWGLFFAGGILIVVAFCWDWRNLMAAGWPRPFHWPLFAIGGAIGAAGFLRALWARGNAELLSTKH
jgi:hypothetical protein